MSPEQAALSNALYDSTKAFEISESECLETDGTTDLSSFSDKAEDQHQVELKIKELDEKSLREHAEKNQGDGDKENGPLYKSFQNCVECNGKTVNVALSKENIKLIKDIRSKERKLKDTRRQLNDERTFYEKQKMDLCKSLGKKKSTSRTAQTDHSSLAVENEVRNLESQLLETQLLSLKKELGVEIQKSMRLRDKCRSLKKRNGLTRSEINLHQENDKVLLQLLEKYWKEVQDKLEKFKIEGGDSKRNSAMLKTVYSQVIKKNAYLSRSNFALQAELRRVYRKLQQIDNISRNNSKSSLACKSSMDLKWDDKEGKRLKKRWSRSRSGAIPLSDQDQVNYNVVISGSLISVHVEGKEKRLRPVFLVLNDGEEKSDKTLKQGDSKTIKENKEPGKDTGGKSASIKSSLKRDKSRSTTQEPSDYKPRERHHSKSRATRKKRRENGSDDDRERESSRRREKPRSDKAKSLDRMRTESKKSKISFESDIVAERNGSRSEALNKSREDSDSSSRDEENSISKVTEIKSDSDRESNDSSSSADRGKKSRGRTKTSKSEPSIDAQRSVGADADKSCKIVKSKNNCTVLKEERVVSPERSIHLIEALAELKGTKQDPAKSPTDQITSKKQKEESTDGNKALSKNCSTDLDSCIVECGTHSSSILQ